MLLIMLSLYTGMRKLLTKRTYRYRSVSYRFRKSNIDPSLMRVIGISRKLCDKTKKT